MTRNGHVRRIGFLHDDRNRVEQRMQRGELERNDPAWRVANRRLEDACGAALAAGVPAERIHAITWREPVMK